MGRKNAKYGVRGLIFGKKAVAPRGCGIYTS